MALEKSVPAALSTACKLRITWWVSEVKLSCTRFELTGWSAIWPDTYTNPLCTTAWL